MNREDRLHGLHLDYYTLGHEEVDPVAPVDSDAAISDGHGDLPMEGEASFCQLVSQAGLVDRFEKTGTQLTVNRDCRAENRFREAIQLLCETSASSVSLRFRDSGIEVCHARSLPLGPDVSRTLGGR